MSNGQFDPPDTPPLEGAVLLDQVQPLASPDPATTDWVPLWNTQGTVTPTTQPSVRVYRSTAQSIPSGAAVSLNFDTARYDVGPSPHWSAGTNPDRLTCQVAGTYVISAALRFAAASGGSNRFVWIDLNGGSSNGGITTGGQTGLAWANTGGPQLSASAVVKLNVGDYVRCVVFQDSGSALNLLNSTATDMTQSDFSMALVGGMQGPAGTAASYGTQLPASPVDGQEHVLVDSVTNPSYQWRFRYNAQSTSAYKWECVGGVPYVGYPPDYTTTGTAAWQVGSVFMTLPRGGQFQVRVSCQIVPSTATQGAEYLNLYLNGSQTSQGGVTTAAAGSPYSLSFAFLWNVPGAGGTVAIGHYSTAALAGFNAKVVEITPIRVS